MACAYGGDLAGKVGDVSRPQHHLAAVALLCGAGVNACTLRHGHGGGLLACCLDGRGLLEAPQGRQRDGAALPAAAHIHLASACRARGVDAGVVQQADVLAQQHVAAALAAAPAGAERAVAHDGQPALAGCVGQGRWIARLRGRLDPQREGAALAPAGVQRGVVDLDVALRGDVDLAALRGCAFVVAVLRGLCVHAALQVHIARCLNVQAATLRWRTQVDTPAGRLCEVRRLHQHAAGAVLACGGVGAAGASGADGAAVGDLGRRDLDLARRAAVFCGAARHGVGADGAAVVYPVAGRQDDASALLLQAMGLDAARVLDHTAHQPVHGLRADDDQAARGLYRVFVLDQRRDLAGFHTDAGQAVAAVKVQVNSFACGQGHRAHLRDHGTLVAHLGGQESDVAA